MDKSLILLLASKHLLTELLDFDVCWVRVTSHDIFYCIGNQSLLFKLRFKEVLSMISLEVLKYIEKAL